MRFEQAKQAGIKAAVILNQRTFIANKIGPVIIGSFV